MNEIMSIRCPISGDCQVEILHDFIIQNISKELLGEYERKLLSSTCDICLTESMTSNCLQLQCKHIFCRDCFQEFLNQKITVNDISSIRCPISHDCHEILYNLIIQHISKELLEKYEKKLLENYLETENYMVRCPKFDCNEVVVLNDESPLLGYCKKCNFQFCTNCTEEYHGIESCLFESESQKKEVTKMYKNAWIIGRRNLEKRYTKKKLQELVGEYNSDQCIQKNCKPCPSCKINIEYGQNFLYNLYHFRVLNRMLL
ncbi:hypothetical protein B4U80_14100 [Leptotrombidium deliense]|uniref:RBR-type E3 ubiquitin transferase n=1 Tax=Leptotrombidium deliense TaxID=299467 RepID=A0A443S2P5_9ACAR|nr:hypothetical protein B4U80_14100 [Leptotrombidium deliense]